MQAPRWSVDRSVRRSTGLTALLVVALLLGGLVSAEPRRAVLAVPPAAPPVVSAARVAVDHPSLIVKRSQYAALRARANRYPWRDMKSQAAAQCRLKYSAKKSTYAKGVRIRDVMGGCSLMYILDPAHASVYRSRMMKVFAAWPAMLKKMKREYAHSKNRWLQVVPPSSGYFNSVLALDVVHDDLSAAQLRSAEKAMDDVAEWYWAADRGWGTATYGARAIWATYQGDVPRRTAAAKAYHQQYLAWLTADGGFSDGTEYALARNGGERTAKQGYLYVAEFTGTDPTYYEDPQIVGFMEWLTGFAYGPFNQAVGFGDSGALGRDLNYSKPETALFTAGRFSKTAARNAGRHIAAGGVTAPGDLLSYSVTTAAPVKASGPQSRVWSASGAAFWQRSNSSNALMGAMWNPKLAADQIGQNQVGFHLHREVNALYLSGYGEPLLMNAGYNGYGKSALGASWTTLHSTASSGNTVTVGGANHVTAAGDGITDDLTGNGFDYATGAGDQIYAGAARHDRSFVLVQPQDGKGGYFLSIDQVSGAEPGQSVDLYFHPPTTAVRTVSQDQEYRSDVALRRSSPTSLSIFLGTRPERTSLDKAVIAGWEKSIRTRRLDARYATDATGQRSTVTVLFPHDRSHAKADMIRVAGPGWSGARIKQGRVRDYAVAADPGVQAAVGGARFAAAAAVFRRGGGQGDPTEFFFARQATAFLSADGRGFDSDEPVSIHLRGKNGKLSASKTSLVTLRAPKLTAVTIDKVRVTTPVAGSVQVRIPAGRHTITLG